MNQETEDQIKDNIACLGRLLEYGENQLIEVAYKGDNHNTRTNLFLWFMEMMFHYSYSICVLSQSRQAHAARALMRNLVEVWINIHYMYMTRGFENVVRLLYSDEIEMLDHNEKLYRFAQSHKRYRSMLTKQQYQEIDSVRRGYISYLKSLRYPMKSAPNLRQKAYQIDKVDDTLQFEELYFKWYKSSSYATHSSPALLRATGEMDSYEFVNGIVDDLEGITATNFLIIYEALKMLRSRFKVSFGLERFNDDWKRLNGQTSLDLN